MFFFAARQGAGFQLTELASNSQGFETRSWYIIQTGLELMVELPALASQVLGL